MSTLVITMIEDDATLNEIKAAYPTQYFRQQGFKQMNIPRFNQRKQTIRVMRLVSESNA